jgi:cytochrome d ubiquinol oxidase subunit II
VAICAFLASIYIIGETTDEGEKSRFIRKAKHMTLAAFIAGALVFVAGYYEGVPISNWIFGNPIGLAAISAALVSLLIQWIFLYRRNTNILRILAGFQVTMILLAVTVRHYPNIVILKDGNYLSLLEHAGHEQTIFYLGAALLIGSIFILPALYYLLYSFHRKTI